MTITNRNRILLAGFIATTIMAIAVIAIAIITIIHNSFPPPAMLNRFFLFTYLPFTQYNQYAALVAPVMCVILVAFFLLRTFFLFEKTQAMEVTFFIWVLFALALEVARVFVPFLHLWEGSSAQMVFISKLIFFARLFSVSCFFSSGMFSSAAIFQQADKNVYILLAATLLISYFIPINTLILNSTFTFSHGFSLQVTILKTILAFLAVASFFIAGKTRGTKSYTSIAFSLTLFLIGYMFLCVCDNFIALICGTALFTYGAQHFLQQLHSYYLWQ